VKGNIKSTDSSLHRQISFLLNGSKGWFLICGSTNYIAIGPWLQYPKQEQFSPCVNSVIYHTVTVSAALRREAGLARGWTGDTGAIE
jgi:hypothetical protein